MPISKAFVNTQQMVFGKEHKKSVVDGSNRFCNHVSGETRKTESCRLGFRISLKRMNESWSSHPESIAEC